MRKRFIVELELPEEATYREALAYIEEAVAAWRGQLRPPGSYDNPNELGDPMWYLESNLVKVIRYTRRRTSAP